MASIYIYGDHSNWHCGSKAVIQYIKHIIKAEGHTLSSYKESDCVLINGEGSIHDNCYDKIYAGAKSIIDGKEVHLINSVWERNSGYQKNLIKCFSSVVVREICSFNNIKNIRPDAKVCFDFSYFYPIEMPKVTYENYGWGGSFWKIPDAEKYIKNKYNAISVNIKEENCWQKYLNKLSSCKMLYTGYHHAVIASCKLRIPFIALKGNTDKVLGIIKMSNANIPVANNLKEFYSLIDNPPPQKEYDKLFDFLASQKPFSLKNIGISKKNT